MFEFRDILDSGIVPVILGGIAFALGVRLLAGMLDHWRIRSYITSRSGQLTACRWWPFGPGWFGEKRDRIYFVTFVDSEGSQHRAYCKTRMFTGVYFTEDRVTQRKDGQRTDALHESLVEENARLREENRRLREALANREETVS